ncbi:VWA domain-containing protein [Burkholderia sp. THE68]|uniref:nitric oxide reductase activation protein NorD n=1 Tax=Burkholderia sp. THE68 TaxID=758782 RepID=UPI00138A6CAF|nr:VWA domain-containing protein [Burkholderia sp. THE68]
MLVAIQSIIEDARVDRLMISEYPGLKLLWRKYYCCGESLQEMSLNFGSLAARLSLSLCDEGYRDPHHWVQKGRELFDSLGTNLSDMGRVREVASVLASDLGQMRVRFETNCYELQPKYRDDNSYLWTDSGEESISGYIQQRGVEAQAVVERGHGAVEPAEDDRVSTVPVDAIFTYPEWNYKSETLRPDWVKVIEGGPPRWDGEDAKSTYRETQLRATRLRYRQAFWFRRVRHQAEGDDIDLEALVNYVVMQRSGEPPDERIFTRAGRRQQEVSVLILLDLSQSTAQVVGNGGQRLIDCQREASETSVALLGHENTRFALHGFASNGRKEVRYVRFKDFGEAHEERSARLLRAVQPAWSTRVGAALRHGANILKSERNPTKTIILVTDGEPSDIDVFDSRYLIEDARHAVDQIAKVGITTQCINVNAAAHDRVCEIFGRRNSLSLVHGSRLADALPSLLAKAVA